MLLTQSFLIRAQKYKLHRLVGKASYVVMPLVILSFFLVAKAGYYKNSKTKSETDALAGLISGIPDMFYLGVLYSLAMIYKKNVGYHLRFFASTGLLILGPGLGRFLIVYCGLPFYLAIPVMILATTGTGLIWLFVDIRQKKPAFPMLIFSCIGLLAFLITTNAHSAVWQSFAKWIVANLF